MSESNIYDAISTRITTKLPGADVAVQGGGGHFAIRVIWSGFSEMGRLARQRAVLQSIADLMSGPNAPVHAVDELITNPTA